MLTFFEASRDLQVGDVVTNDAILESYPNYFIRPGARFVVVRNDLNEMHASLWLRLVDKERNTAGDTLADWDDCVVIYDPHWMGECDRDEDGVDTTEALGLDPSDPRSAWQNVLPGNLRRDNSLMGEHSRQGHVLDYADKVKAEAPSRSSEPVAEALSERNG